MICCVQHGWRLILSFTGLLNEFGDLEYATINSIDGGHIIMSLYEMVMRRPILQISWVLSKEYSFSFFVLHAVHCV